MKRNQVAHVLRRFEAWHSGKGSFRDVIELLGAPVQEVNDMMQGNGVMLADGKSNPEFTLQQAMNVFLLFVALRSGF